MNGKGWIGVDLDGTLAKYYGWQGELHIGEPIEPMVQSVKSWLAAGVEVKIVTARVSASQGRAVETVAAIEQAIQNWCAEHIGHALPVICCKDFGMVELWDDRAIQLVPNTGQTIAEFHGVDEAESIKKHLQLERTKAVDNADR